MTCHHICACGAELRCNREPDKCAAGANWQCPSCEMADFDAWVEAQHERNLDIIRAIKATELAKNITAPEQEKDK